MSFFWQLGHGLGLPISAIYIIKKQEMGRKSINSSNFKWFNVLYKRKGTKCSGMRSVQERTNTAMKKMDWFAHYLCHVFKFLFCVDYIIFYKFHKACAKRSTYFAFKKTKYALNATTSEVFIKLNKFNHVSTVHGIKECTSLRNCLIRYKNYYSLFIEIKLYNTYSIVLICTPKVTF